MQQYYTNYSSTTSVPQGVLQLDQMAARRTAIPPRTGPHLSGRHVTRARDTCPEHNNQGTVRTQAKQDRTPNQK